MKSIGIDPGDQAVKIVELDGSYKKTRLVRVHVAPAGALGADGGTRVDVVAAAAREALDAGMRGDVSVGHPCREAVLRTLELPFKGHEAIRKVIKSEIEGEIQSQSVDDMVVDFHEIGEGPTGGTRIIVASVPKAGLRAQLVALTANAIEPETIDLDTMALWRVAHWAGAFAAPAAGEAGAGDVVARVTAVVDIGARSVKVLLVEGERLVEMRALRLGDGVVADEIARKHGLDPAVARDAVRSCLASGADQHLEVAPAMPAKVATADGKDAHVLELPPDAGSTVAAEGEAEAEPRARAVVVRHAEVESSHAAYLQRLGRELTRFLTASGRANQMRSVFVTGGGSRIRGTHEMLAAVFGAEVKELDVLGHLQHELGSEQVEDLAPRLATAVGLALGRLGGPRGFQLRQEDLLLTRGFERVKFSLAIACMVGLLAMFVHWNKKQLELANLELEIGRTYIDKKNPKAPVAFYGMLNAVFASSWFDKPEQFHLEHQKGKDYTFKSLVEELNSEAVHKRLAIVRDRLKAVADQKQKDSGIYEDVSMESGLAVLVRWAELMKANEPQLGRYLVTKIDLSMKSPNRRLEFTVAFRGDDFRARQGVLQRAIEAEFEKPDSPFEKSDKETGKKDVEPFRDPSGSGVDPNVVGAYVTVTMNVKDAFQPFGPSATNTVGAADVHPARAVGADKNEVATTGAPAPDLPPSPPVEADNNPVATKKAGR